jgi:hypothetical protein
MGSRGTCRQSRLLGLVQQVLVMSLGHHSKECWVGNHDILLSVNALYRNNLFPFSAYPLHPTIASHKLGSTSQCRHRYKKPVHSRIGLVIRINAIINLMCKFLIHKLYTSSSVVEIEQAV